MIELDLPENVRDLARLVRAVLAEETIDGFAITEAMADFAIHRHKCGPMLYRAIRTGGLADEAASAKLSEHWRENRSTHLRNSLSTDRLGQALATASIPALLFKGAPLAKALYRDPLWRHCGDVDVLVPQSEMVRALALLAKAGFQSADPVTSLPPAAQQLVLAITRDVPIDDGWAQSHVEVHSRVLFSRRLSRFLTSLDNSMQPGPVAQDGLLDEPVVGVGLTLYLIFHGGVSGWCRLKWLADLIPLLEQLGPDGRDALAAAAERSRTAAMVKASLVLLLAAFGDLDIAPLDGWIREKAGSDAAWSRARRYCAWLGGDGSRMPLTTRHEIMRSTVLLDDRLSDQAMTLLASGLSSGVRQIATTAARSIRSTPSKALPAS